MFLAAVSMRRIIVAGWRWLLGIVLVKVEENFQLGLSLSVVHKAVTETYETVREVE